MKRINVLQLLSAFTLTVALIAGCSSAQETASSVGTKSTPETASQSTRSHDAARKALVNAGFECAEPAPYKPAPDELDLGVTPSAVFSCTVEGGAIDVVGFKSAADTQVMIGIAESFACSFETAIRTINGELWVASIDDESGGDHDEILAKASAATGVKASAPDCDNSDSKPTGEVSQGVGSKDASADVSGAKITREGDEYYTTVEVQLDVKNNSEKRSDYSIEVAIESPDGSIRHDSTSIYIENLEPGQTTVGSTMITEDIPDDAVAVVKKVERTASL